MKTFKVHTSSGRTIEIKAEATKATSSWLFFLVGQKIVARAKLLAIEVIEED